MSAKHKKKPDYENSAPTDLREWGITLLRVGTGATFLLHHRGALVDGLSTQAGTECLLGVALILGLFTRWVSIPLAIGMLVDVLLIHWPKSFTAPDAQFEYALLRLTASCALVLVGPGRLALGKSVAFQRIPLLYRLQG
jgi:DoxX